MEVCLVIVLASCSEGDEPELALTPHDRNIIEYFTDVALGFEFGSAPEITRKWVTNMKILVGGEKTPELSAWTTTTEYTDKSF